MTARIPGLVAVLQLYVARGNAYFIDCRVPGFQEDSTTKPVPLRITSHVVAPTGTRGSGADRLRLVWRIRRA